MVKAYELTLLCCSENSEWIKGGLMLLSATKAAVCSDLKPGYLRWSCGVLGVCSLQCRDRCERCYKIHICQGEAAPDTVS